MIDVKHLGTQFKLNSARHWQPVELLQGGDACIRAEAPQRSLAATVISLIIYRHRQQSQLCRDSPWPHVHYSQERFYT